MKLLFNYLPFSMKESDSVVRSKKKAKSTNNTNGNGKTKVASPTKLLNNNNNHHNHKSNGTNGNNHTSKNSKAPSRSSSSSTTITTANNTGIESTKIKKKRLKKIKDRPINSRKASSTVTNTTSPRGSRRGNSKSSPELRPRRRASQTYFFKYQLARNPLKAEEEDLKQALLASLQQCGNSTSTNSDSQDDLNDQLHPKTQKQQPNQQQNNHNNHQPHNHQNNKSVNYKQPKHEEQLQQVAKAPPKIYDEEYLRKYRPETEDFLTFICFRVTAPNNNSLINGIKTEPTADETNNNISNSTTSNNTNQFNNCNNYYTNHNNTGNKTSEKLTSNDSHNLRRSSSPHKLTANSNASNSSPNPISPSHRRRPTRQSPRLASSNRKISESDNTAFDTINYEEDMKKASIALEDMAQEINSKDDIHKEVAQNSSDCGTRLSNSPYKNNKHLVKGLMTREFAGGFADEEIIFESISNHML